MSNIIAVIWDFDKTLINGYMQDPFFAEYNIDPQQFWKEVNELPILYREKGIQVNADTIYLNYMIQYAKKHNLTDLNNEKLKSYGSKQNFYPGALDLIQYLNDGVLKENNKIYDEYGIKVENYIVSTGIKKIIEGSEVAPLVKKIWGCEFIDNNTLDENLENGMISEVGYTIDNTTKTRAIFEIHKGLDINVNDKMPEELRRVKFQNMIYIADGPSDIPAFSLVNKNGGATFAIYPKGNINAFRQVEKMRKDGRINMFAEADYRRDTTAYMWITNKVREFADRIYKSEKNKLESAVSSGPRHIIQE